VVDPRSSRINWTLFDRAAPNLGLESVRDLGAANPVVLEAAALLGLFPWPFPPRVGRLWR
jgi:hypothetical protein